jgi:hypothetical protein
MQPWEIELAKLKAEREGLNKPEQSYLYSSSNQMNEQPSYDLGAKDYSSKIATQGAKTEKELAELMTSGGSGALDGGPMSAAISVGGTLLAQTLANQAQAEQNKRQRAMEIAQQHAQGEREGINQMLSAWRALR